METSDRSAEELVMTRLLRVSAGVSGLVTGLIAGLGIFVATNWLVLKGGPRVGPHLALLAQFFLGYRVTFLGSLIGFAYGFALGFAVGYAVAWLYNLVLYRRQGPSTRAAGGGRARLSRRDH
jgi:hypothetical protein